MKLISDHPPGDGKEYDCQCARCGSSVEYVRCDECEDGFNGHECGEDCCACAFPEENVPCDICRGRGGWHRCMSSPEWCNANPLDGRDEIERGKFEWFVVNRSRDIDDFGSRILDDDLSEEWGRQHGN